MKKQEIYCADFETTSSKQYELEGSTRVYLWKLMGVYDNVDEMGVDIDSFIKYCLSLKNNSIIYFHNLSFDGEFIIWYLLENNYNYVDEIVEDDKRNMIFTAVIDISNSIYQIVIKNENKIEFRCSYKLFPKSIKDIGEMVGIPKLNETHNYEEIKNYRSVDELTEEEKMYITNDVKIMVELIKYLRSINVRGMTMSASAYKDWRKDKYLLCKNDMKKSDNEEVVEIVRKSYKGGITKVNPKYANVEFNDVISFDVNSLYPSVMYENTMPIGEGEIYPDIRTAYRHGKRKFIMCVFVMYAKVRKGKHAFIGSQSGFSYARKYSYDEEMTNKMLYLWYDEFRLFTLIYDAQFVVQKVVGFRQAKDVFKPYIDRWYKVKENAKTGAERSLAKLMLNSLYGKFGMNENRISKLPVGVSDDSIIYKTNEKCTIYYYKEVASYITSMARCKLVSFMNRCDDRFLYCDTDSVYIIGSDIPEVFREVIDDKKLGYWKYEGHYTRFKSLKAKCYLKQLDNGELVRRIAGCPKECAELINFDNFNWGLKLVNAKRCKKKVNGGIIIGNTDFTIKIDKEKVNDRKTD